MDRRQKYWHDIYTSFSSRNKAENDINVYSSHGWYRRIEVFISILEELKKKHEIFPGMNAIDLGCGTGMYSRLMKKQNMNVFSLDLCHGMLKYAKNVDNSLNYVNADCSLLPFKDKSLDFIICFGVITIISDTEPFFNEIERVSKDKSRIMLMTLNKDYIRNLLKSILGERVLPADLGIIHYSMPDLKNRVSKVFSDSTINFIPVFIFPFMLRFLEPVFQKLKILHFTGRLLASAFIISIEKKNAE